MTNKDTPRHQNYLDNNLYNGFISKDPSGPEGPQAAFETINKSSKLLKSKNSSKFKIGKYTINIISDEKDID